MNCPPAAQLASLTAPLPLDLAGPLSRVDIAWESWGTLNDAGDNAVLVIPAFSANCHAKSSSRDPSRGWWEFMIGPGRPLDTDRWFVLCASLLGGCDGTTGPLSEDPSHPGQPWRGRFPLVTIADLARCHERLVEHLGITSLHAAIGGSMGAMQALTLGLQSPHLCRSVIAISGTDRTRPSTAAIRHLGRRAIMLDEHYRDGFYEDEGPRDGVRLAREIGTVFYRSKGEFNERFSWSPVNEPTLKGDTFDVQSYLSHQGRKIASHFDANSYLRLSLAMDLHDISQALTQKPRGGEAPWPQFHIGGVREDRLMPVDEQIGLHEALVAAGASSRIVLFSSSVGHDAFLVEHEDIAAFTAESLGSRKG